MLVRCRRTPAPHRPLRGTARAPRRRSPSRARRARSRRGPARDRDRRRREPLLELARELGRADAHVDLEEALEAPGLEVARPGEDVLAVADERLRVQHLRVLEDLDARVQEPAVVEPLGEAAGPVVRIARDEQPHARAPPGGALDPLDHAAVGHVGVDDVERLARRVEQLRDRVGDRPEAARARCAARPRARASPRACAGNRLGSVLDRHGAAEAAEAREHDELELRDDRPLEPEEQVVEAAVLEVVLDPGAADPADPAVDDEQLAVVDVARACRASSGSGGRRRRAARTARAPACRSPCTPARRRRPAGRRTPSTRAPGRMPFRSTTIRTGTPSRAFASSASAKRSPTAPGRKPNWTMCTDDVARRDVLEHPREEARPADEHLAPSSPLLSSNASARSR